MSSHQIPGAFLDIHRSNARPRNPADGARLTDLWRIVDPIALLSRELKAIEIIRATVPFNEES